MRFEIKNDKPDEAVAFFNMRKDGDGIMLVEELPDKKYNVLRVSADGLYICPGISADAGFPVDRDGHIAVIDLSLFRCLPARPPNEFLTKPGN